MQDLTADMMYGGGLRLSQRRQGYRFGIDAVLLGGGRHEPRPGRVLDLGTGCGIVALTVALFDPGVRVVGVEVQPSLAALARANVVANAMEGRIEVIEADAREVGRWSSRARSAGRLDGAPPWLDVVAPGFDLVLMNPPFFPPGSGLRNPDGERAAARHQLHGTLAQLLRSARLMTRPSGVIRTIFPADQLAALMTAVAEAGLKVSRLRPIHSFGDAPAELVLADARMAGRRELVLAPPLVLYERPEVYSEPLRTLLGGRAIVL